MPDDEDSAVPGGKGIDGLILDYQKLGQQAGGQPGGVKQNGRYSSKLGGSGLVSQNRVQASADILIIITPIILKYLISILTPYMSVPCLNSGPH